jgi:hypothetical protein
MSCERNWAPEQVRILADNPDTPAEMLVAEIALAGPYRSIQAIVSKRRVLGREAPREKSTPDLPWPTMRGTAEERDRRYVRLLLSHQLVMVRAGKLRAA